MRGLLENEKRHKDGGNTKIRTYIRKLKNENVRTWVRETEKWKKPDHCSSQHPSHLSTIEGHFNFSFQLFWHKLNYWRHMPLHTLMRWLQLCFLDEASDDEAGSGQSVFRGSKSQKKKSQSYNTKTCRKSKQSKNKKLGKYIRFLSRFPVLWLFSTVLDFPRISEASSSIYFVSIGLIGLNLNKQQLLTRSGGGPHSSYLFK